MNETDRPHRALEEFDALWLESHAAKLPGPSLETTMLRNIAASVRAALAPEQREDAEPQEGTREALNLETLRERGWSVAVHNDYRLNGERFTFWLLTRGDRCVKGEGRTDAEAFEQIAAALAAPPQEGERQPCGAVHHQGRVAHRCVECRELVPATIPTPDRELPPDHDDFVETRAPGLHSTRRQRRPDREALDEFEAAIRYAVRLDEGGVTIGADSYELASRKAWDRVDALRSAALAALPGGREQERLYCGFPPCDFWCHADTAPYFDNCPKCLGSFSFASPRRRPTAAPQASADTGERA
jgi:hypothetical protein